MNRRNVKFNDLPRKRKGKTFLIYEFGVGFDNFIQNSMFAIEKFGLGEVRPPERRKLRKKANFGIFSFAHETCCFDCHKEAFLFPRSLDKRFHNFLAFIFALCYLDAVYIMRGFASLLTLLFLSF